MANPENEFMQRVTAYLSKTSEEAREKMAKACEETGTPFTSYGACGLEEAYDGTDSTDNQVQ